MRIDPETTSDNGNEPHPLPPIDVDIDPCENEPPF